MGGTCTFQEIGTDHDFPGIKLKSSAQQRDNGRGKSQCTEQENILIRAGVQTGLRVLTYHAQGCGLNPYSCKNNQNVSTNSDVRCFYIKCINNVLLN